MFIGNPQQYSKLESWISRSITIGEKLQYKHICIIIGDSGVGKSYGIQNVLDVSKKKIYKINDLECTNSKDFKDLLFKITSSHIISQFEQTTNQDKIIWIDDFDSFLIYDRRFLHTLEDILESENIPAIKIIISTTSADIKHYTKFYQKGLILQLKNPEVADIIILLRKTFPKLPVKVIGEIADYSNGNISIAIEIATLKDSKNKTKETLKQSNKNNLKDINTNILTKDSYPLLVNLFNIPYNIKIGSYLFDQDPWLHPLRFHENVLHEWSIRNGTNTEKEHNYIKMLKLFCDWDQLMTYSKINDTNMNIPIELISYVPIYIKDFPKKKDAVSSMDEFTRMFNYLSLKKKNMVALYTTSDFPWITLGSYFKHLYDDKNKKNKIKK
jgi:hypothetical protein